MVIQNLILAMSLSGSVVVLLYLLTYPLAKRYFPLKWRYLVLKLALVFYLVPFPYYTCRSDFFLWLRGLSPFIRKIYPRNPDESLSATKQILKVAVSIKSPGEILLSEKMKQLVLIMTFLLFIAFSAVLWYWIRYQRVKSRLLKETQGVGAEQWDLFQKVKKEVGVRGKVRLVSSKLCRTPLVTGIFRPVVVLPLKEGFCDPSDEYMIKHELLHIRNHDLLVKLLGFVALAVHWFNPLCHILYHELMNLGELCCDRDVLQGKGDEARKEYGMLLLELATEKESVSSSRFVSGLLQGRGEREMKRRILEMKESRRKHLLLSGLMLVCIGAAGILAGFTYERPMILDETEEMPVHNQEEAFTGSIKELWEDGWVELTLDSFIPSEYDWFDKEGERHPISEPDETAKLCDHEFCQEGELLRREGGRFFIPLEEERYEALRCSQCGYVERGEQIIYIPSDHYWISEEKTVIRERDMALSSEGCSHVDVPDGKVYEHQKEEEGCRTVFYEGIRCSLCGRIEAGTQQGDMRYTNCIHRYRGQGYDTP